MPSVALTLSGLAGSFTNLGSLTTDNTTESVASVAANAFTDLTFSTNAGSVIPAGNVVLGIEVTIKGGLPSGQTSGNKIEFASAISMPAVNLTNVQSVFTRGGGTDPMGVTDKSQLASLVLRFTAGPQATTWYMRYVAITVHYGPPPDPTLLSVDIYPSSIIWTEGFTQAEFAKAIDPYPSATSGVYTGSTPVNGTIGGNVRMPFSAHLPANAVVQSLSIFVYARTSVAGRMQFGFFTPYNPAGPSSVWTAEPRQNIGTTDAWFEFTKSDAELLAEGWTTAKLRDDANNEWRFGLISTNATSTTTTWHYVLIRVKYRLPPPNKNVLFIGENF